jgi:hypothetical protein
MLPTAAGRLSLLTEVAVENRLTLSRRTTWWLIGAAVVVAVTCAAGWYWTFRAHELSNYRPLQRGMRTVMNLGYTAYATQLIGPDDNFLHDTTLDLVDVRPVIVENSARATVRVLLCVPSDQGEGLGSRSDTCRAEEPFHAGRVNLDQIHYILVLAITPTRPGSLDIAGLQVTYRDGIRHGEQHTGNEIRSIVPG